MECPDPHRKVMFVNPLSSHEWRRMYGVNLQKKSFLLGIG